MTDWVQCSNIMAEVYHKLHNGDIIKDKELLTTISTMGKLVKMLRDLGPRFYIVWRHLNEDLMKLQDYAKARNLIK